MSIPDVTNSPGNPSPNPCDLLISQIHQAMGFSVCNPKASEGLYSSHSVDELEVNTRVHISGLVPPSLARGSGPRLTTTILNPWQIDQAIFVNCRNSLV